MNYDIAAIETNYRGRLYRSRLEARWAAMFDLLGWQYEYEPFDFNGWFPDFIIKAHNAQNRVLVEVKPIIAFDQETADKIDKSCPFIPDNSEEVLIVGATILRGDVWTQFLRLGWMRDAWAWAWDEALFFTSEGANGQIGFFHSTGCYSDRITGTYDGDHHMRDVPWDDIWDKWQEAGNIVQYRHKP